jgi:hypothetical protein
VEAVQTTLELTAAVVAQAVVLMPGTTMLFWFLAIITPLSWAQAARLAMRLGRTVTPGGIPLSIITRLWRRAVPEDLTTVFVAQAEMAGTLSAR